MTRPGAWLRSLASRLLEPWAMERLNDPAIADLRQEYDAALRRGLAWRGRGIQLAGYAAFWKVLAIAAARETLFERTADEDRSVGRALTFSLAAFVALTALQVWWSWSTFRRPGTVTMSWLALYLTPHAVLNALPFGLVFGIALGLRARTSTTRVTWTIVAFALGCSAAALFIVGWLIPASNQAFRELPAGGRIWRGINELTLGELSSGDPARLMLLISGGLNATRIAFVFHFRVAFACAPLILGLFSLGLHEAMPRVNRPVTVGLIALTACGAYDVLQSSAGQAMFDRDWLLPPVATEWAPNLAFLMTALVLTRLSAATRMRESLQ